MDFVGSKRSKHLVLIRADNMSNVDFYTFEELQELASQFTTIPAEERSAFESRPGTVGGIYRPLSAINEVTEDEGKLLFDI